MADEIDRANAAAEVVREAQISSQLARAKQPRAPALHAQDGRRLCVDCREPISAQRLAAVPHAVACIDCEAVVERHRQSYRQRGG